MLERAPAADRRDRLAAALGRRRAVPPHRAAARGARHQHVPDARRRAGGEQAVLRLDEGRLRPSSRLAAEHGFPLRHHRPPQAGGDGGLPARQRRRAVRGPQPHGMRARRIGASGILRAHGVRDRRAPHDRPGRRGARRAHRGRSSARAGATYLGDGAEGVIVLPVAAPLPRVPAGSDAGGATRRRLFRYCACGMRAPGDAAAASSCSGHDGQLKSMLWAAGPRGTPGASRSSSDGDGNRPRRSDERSRRRTEVRDAGDPRRPGSRRPCTAR